LQLEQSRVVTEPVFLLPTLLLLAILPSLWARLERLTVLDAFLMSFAAYFGVYTLVDLYTKAAEDLDDFNVVVVFGSVAVVALILWIFSRSPSREFQLTSLDRLLADAANCRLWAAVGLFGVTLANVVATRLIWQEYGYAAAAGGGASLPYWYTSLGMMAEACTFPAAVCLYGKAKQTKGLVKPVLFGVVGVASFFLLVAFGRRAFFALAIVVGWDLLRDAKRRGNPLRMGALLAFAVPALLLASNFFQAYRVMSFRGALVDETLDMGEAVSMATNVDTTRMNLEHRMAMWRFNYEVVDAHVTRGEPLQLGDISLSGIANVIPSALFQKEDIQTAELALLRAVGVDDGDDRPDNIFATLYADFGLVSAPVVAALIVLFAWMVGIVLGHMRDPFMRLLLLGMAVYYALNLETSIHAPLMIARNFALAAIIYLAARETMRAFYTPRAVLGSR
jgi:hypothetical protein